MTSPFYTPTGKPASGGQGSSSDIRAEFLAIETAMDKLPALTADYVVKVNAAGTALEPVQYLDPAQGGTGAGTFTENGLLIGKAASPVAVTAALADGEIVIGRTGNVPVTATLTAGSGITITEAAGAITIKSTITANLADGVMLVGDGSSTLAEESGATLRTSIGIGTGDALTVDSFTCKGDKMFTGLTNSTTLLGDNSGQDLTAGGTTNTCIGANALFAAVTTTGCTSIGYSTLLNNTADDITAVGARSLGNNSTGLRNTAVGTKALNKVTTAADNTSLGFEAAELTTGASNTAVGASCLAINTTGVRNSALGHNAGTVVLTGTDNVLLGYATDVSATGAIGQIAIGASIACDQDNQVTIGNSSGNIKNEFDTDAVWTQACDLRRKNVIGDAVLGLDFINALRPVTYTLKPASELPEEWGVDPKTKFDTTKVMHSMIAQDVLAAIIGVGVDPETFSGWSEDSQGQRISKEAMVIPLIKAVHELTARLVALENK